MLIRNARVFLPDGQFQTTDVRFTDTIAELGQLPGAGALDATGLYLVPGFFDIHTHGATGGDASRGTCADIGRMARHHAAHGVTRFLAASMTLPPAQLLASAEAVAAFAPSPDMACCEGLFLEGPFLSNEKRGAQCAEHLAAPDIALFERVRARAGDRLRMVCVAPETMGALPFIRHAAKVCTVAVGHTAAGYDTAAAAFSAGATVLTHLFNAMPPLLHRAPGPIGAGMDANAYAELIVDGLHVAPAAVRAAFRLFPERVVLVSDSLPCAGLPDGDYTLGTQPVRLRGGRCTLRDTDTLAGSVITVLDALAAAVRYGVPLPQAVAAATHNPARALGLDGQCGCIRPGMPADLVLLDDSLSLRHVFLRGAPLPA